MGYVEAIDIRVLYHRPKPGVFGLEGMQLEHRATGPALERGGGIHPPHIVQLAAAQGLADGLHVARQQGPLRGALERRLELTQGRGRRLLPDIQGLAQQAHETQQVVGLGLHDLRQPQPLDERIDRLVEPLGLQGQRQAPGEPVTELGHRLAQQRETLLPVRLLPPRLSREAAQQHQRGPGLDSARPVLGNVQLAQGQVVTPLAELFTGMGQVGLEQTTARGAVDRVKGENLPRVTRRLFKGIGRDGGLQGLLQHVDLVGPELQRSGQDAARVLGLPLGTIMGDQASVTRAPPRVQVEALLELFEGLVAQLLGLERVIVRVAEHIPAAVEAALNQRDAQGVIAIGCRRTPCPQVIDDIAPGVEHIVMVAVLLRVPGKNLVILPFAGRAATKQRRPTQTLR